MRKIISIKKAEKMEKDTLGVGKKKKTQAFPKKDEKTLRHRGAKVRVTKSSKALTKEK